MENCLHWEDISGNFSGTHFQTYQGVSNAADLVLELIRDKTEISATRCPLKDSAWDNQISFHTNFCPHACSCFLPLCCKSSLFVFIHDRSAAGSSFKAKLSGSLDCLFSTHFSLADSFNNHKCQSTNMETTSSINTFLYHVVCVCVNLISGQNRQIQQWKGFGKSSVENLWGKVWGNCDWFDSLFQFLWKCSCKELLYFSGIGWFNRWFYVYKHFGVKIEIDFDTFNL